MRYLIFKVSSCSIAVCLLLLLLLPGECGRRRW
jgi:hypothetical protein